MAAAAWAAAPPAFEKFVGHLESPERAAWQKPDEVVAALGLEGGETVADIGAGSGYFARRLARAVGPAGSVLALDVRRDLLGELSRRAAAERVENLKPELVEADNPHLAARSVDLVFLCNTLHEIEHRADYLGHLAPALKPGARVVVVDFHRRDDIPEGPPFERKVARETVIEEFRQAGFAVDREAGFLPYQYFLVFRPAETPTLDDLVRGVAAAVHRQGTMETRAAGVQDALGRFLAFGSLDERYQHPAPGKAVTTYLLHAAADGSFSIAALVIRPGAATPLHDHQAWVVWGTYRGRDRERRFLRRDRLGEEFPDLEPVFTKLFPDDGLSFIPPPPADVHRVENAWEHESVSIHVHSTDIAKQTRNAYDLDKRVVLHFVQSYETPQGR